MSFWDVFFEEGNINTVVGRPKLGKTNLAVDMGFKAIERGYTVLSNIIFFKPWNVELAKQRNWLSKDIDYLAKPEKFKYVPVASKLVLEASLTDNNIIIIDEAGLTASTYKALSNTSVQMRYLGYSIRKIGGCLIIIAQTKKSVVPDLREELVSYEVHLIRETDDSRAIDILKRNEFYNKETKEYDIEFVPYDKPRDIPLAPIPYDTKSTAGFVWDVDLYQIYYEIILREYDAIEARQHLPDIVRDLVIDKKVDDFMKRKKFMHIGTVALLLNKSEQTIRNWADEGILNCIRTDKGTRLFSRDEVTKYAIKKGILKI